MTILYRSPDVLVDGVLWHVTVNCSRSGRVATCFRFREKTSEAWRPVTSWPRRLPKGFREFFRPFWRSIEIAKVGPWKTIARNTTNDHPRY
jgi:hypothetical protein